MSLGLSQLVSGGLNQSQGSSCFLATIEQRRSQSLPGPARRLGPAWGAWICPLALTPPRVHPAVPNPTDGQPSTQRRTSGQECSCSRSAPSFTLASRSGCSTGHHSPQGVPHQGPPEARVGQQGRPITASCQTEGWRAQCTTVESASALPQTHLPQPLQQGRLSGMLLKKAAELCFDLARPPLP